MYKIFYEDYVNYVKVVVSSIRPKFFYKDHADCVKTVKASVSSKAATINQTID